MLTRVVKWTAIVSVATGLLWRSSPDLLLVLQFVVTAAAIVILVQAATMHRFVWMALFLLVACLFNPIVPLPSSSYFSGLAGGFSFLLFFFSLELLKPRPRLTIASITDRKPGSQSL